MGITEEVLSEVVDLFNDVVEQLRRSPTFRCVAGPTIRNRVKKIQELRLCQDKNKTNQG